MIRRFSHLAIKNGEKVKKFEDRSRKFEDLDFVN